MYIFIGVTLLILAGIILYPKAKYNKSVKEQNNLLRKENDALNKEADELIKKLDDLQIQALNKEQELKFLNWKTENIEASEQKIFQTTKEKYELMKENEFKEINRIYSLKHEELAEHYVDAKDSAKEAYLLMLEDAVSAFQVEFNQLGAKIDEQKKLLEFESNLVQLAIEARKRAEEEEEKKNFYRLQIPQSDLEDIEKLNEVALLLNTPEALYKTIWKVYYEKPYTDLVGRVLGDKPITGIYKITNIKDGKSYVGQSANVQERWKQHIKRGCRAESPTRNKLYPAMIEEGVHNFYFELLEECPREQLDAQEDYWQSFYQTNSYGYSIK